MDYGSVGWFAWRMYCFQVNDFLFLETGQLWEDQQVSGVPKYENIMIKMSCLLYCNIRVTIKKYE